MDWQQLPVPVSLPSRTGPDCGRMRAGSPHSDRRSLSSDQFDPDTLASILERDGRNVFAGLIRPPLARKHLTITPCRPEAMSSPARASCLIQLSRLAARASRYNVEIGVPGLPSASAAGNMNSRLSNDLARRYLPASIHDMARSHAGPGTTASTLSLSLP